MDELVKWAKQIITENIYITIATTDENGNPWVSPVFSAFDENYTFYWNSPVEAKHSVALKTNNNVALVIFNSSSQEGTGEGVYVEAKAYEITDKDELEKALKLLYARKNKPPKEAKYFTGDAPRRMYKAVPIRFWMNTDEVVNGRHHDARIEIKL